MRFKIITYWLTVLPILVFGQHYLSYSKNTEEVSVKLSDGYLVLRPMNENAVRIQFIKEIKPEENQFVFINENNSSDFKFKENTSSLKLKTKNYAVLFNKKTAQLTFLDSNGKVLLSEAVNSRKLTESRVSSQSCYIAEQSFINDKDEQLLGLGQFQDGHYNLKNISRKLIQVNSQIALPFLYSSKGYGILWNQFGLTWYNPADESVPLEKEAVTDGVEREVTGTSGTVKVSQQQALHTGKILIKKDGEYTFMLDLGNMDNRHFLSIDGKPIIDQSNLWLPPAVSTKVFLTKGEHHFQVICKATNSPSLQYKSAEDISTFRSPHSKSLDYILFVGNNSDEIISSYREITGKVPMLPKWAFGYWQCRERYTSAEHLVKTVEEFRKRNLPVDVIVQDWQYWGKYGWGVPKFDEQNYAEPEKFIEKLHQLHSKFSVSVWENLDKKSEVAKDYDGLYIPDSPWIDIFNPKTQKIHWNALNKNLFHNGVDSWWMDATEPENDALVGKNTFFGIGEFYRLTYPFFVSKAVYEGQRATNPDKRVVILTRSAFPGQQRFGTINWSGDIGWDWDAYRRQIVAGLNYSISGMPYWTTDIGGFFRPGSSQYSDPKYHDILMRWFQWGVFSPVFRMHGYQSETEPWKYGEKIESDMRDLMNLRYQLLPYIYSQSWEISKNNSTIMRPMVMDFQGDKKAIEQSYQYMFGKSILVAPVIKPNVENWDVYLPNGYFWYDFYTNQKNNGGKTILADASQNKIPLFIKSGSIIPFGRVMQYSSEKSNEELTIKIYAGNDGNFTLYEDEGDNYNYEKGNYTLIPFKWNDKKRKLQIETRSGFYRGQTSHRIFNLEIIGINKEVITKKIFYEGNELTIKF
ncbi:TIM-barrel domain-containing protein [Chryseobacterium lineare]